MVTRHICQCGNTDYDIEGSMGFGSEKTTFLRCKKCGLEWSHDEDKRVWCPRIVGTKHSPIVIVESKWKKALNLLKGVVYGRKNQKGC